MCNRITKCLVRLKSFALRRWQPLIPSPESSPHRREGSIYIVIYRQTFSLFTYIYIYIYIYLYVCISVFQYLIMIKPYIKFGLMGLIFSCYITYDMNFRFFPCDPVCFDKLSRCDEKTGIWQHIRALGYNRCVTGRRPRDENHVVSFKRSAENYSRTWDTQPIRSSLTSLQGDASIGTRWLPEEDSRRNPLSEYMSLYLSLK